MIKYSTARRYATALIELIEEKEIDPLCIGESLTMFANLVDTHSHLKHVLVCPGFTLAERRRILTRLHSCLGWIYPMDRFVDFLLTHHRIIYLKRIAACYQNILDQKQDRVRVRVQSALPLDNMTSFQLRQALVQFFDKQIIIEEQIEPELIAGISIQVNGFVVDGSIAGQLTRLKEQLTRIQYKEKGS